MEMKTKMLALLLALCLLLSGNAFALNYQQHFDNASSFETLEEAHLNGPAALAELTGRNYLPDPALDSYPAGTTYVYRSARMYTDLSAAYRMNTNILVFVNRAFNSKDEAFAYLQELGVIEIVDRDCGSVLLVTPIDGEAGFGAVDQYAYFQLQSAMCNLGFAVPQEDGTRSYYADNTYFGGLTYRYVIGIDEGASFINNYIATTLDDVSRIAGLLLIGGKIDDISNVAGLVPAYLVNADEKTVAKYTAANETDAYSIVGDEATYFNQARPQQSVRVAQSETIDAALIQHVYDSYLTSAMRVPAIRSGVHNGNMLYANYNFNQAPYTLSKRVPIVDGTTADGIVVLEKVDDRFSDVQTDKGEYLQTWYEFLPEEVLNNTAPAGSVPLWLANHGGGDDPVQFVDEIGLLELAREERHAIVAAENQSIGAIRNVALPRLVEYMLETYPALDASRVYTTGYSMGGGATFNAMCGNPKIFAAGIPMAAVTYNATEEEEKQFEEIDIPVLLMTSTYDYFYDTSTYEFRTSSMCDYPTMLNDYFSYNELDTVEYDFANHPLCGFAADSYRRITLNNEYVNHTWLRNNAEGVPMVGLSVTEFLPHGLYPEYAKIAWDFAKHYSRNTETGEVIYDPWAR